MGLENFYYFQWLFADINYGLMKTVQCLQVTVDDEEASFPGKITNENFWRC